MLYKQYTLQVTPKVCNNSQFDVRYCIFRSNSCQCCFCRSRILVIFATKRNHKMPN